MIELAALARSATMMPVRWFSKMTRSLREPVKPAPQRIAVDVPEDLPAVLADAGLIAGLLEWAVQTKKRK